LSNQIQEQEKSQVLIWAKAITEKSYVLKISNDVFQKLRAEERKKVEITSKTTQIILSDRVDKNLPLYLDILKLNDQIPIISTDREYNILESRNLESTVLIKGAKLSQKEHPEFFKYPPVEVNFLGKKNYLFYQDSKIFQQLSKIKLQTTHPYCPSYLLTIKVPWCSMGIFQRTSLKIRRN
jgi:hypothetical protein